MTWDAGRSGKVQAAATEVFQVTINGETDAGGVFGSATRRTLDSVSVSVFVSIASGHSTWLCQGDEAAVVSSAIFRGQAMSTFRNAGHRKRATIRFGGGWYSVFDGL